VVGGRLRPADVLDALVRRNAGASGEHQQGDDEAPEVQLAAIAEWMHRVRRLAGTAQAVQQQEFIQVSTSECTPSLSMAELPEMPAAMNWRWQWRGCRRGRRR
jgi:hypothetical protein